MNLERNGLELDDLDAVQHWADKIKEELNRNRFWQFGQISMHGGGSIINLCKGVN